MSLCAYENGSRLGLTIHKFVEWEWELLSGSGRLGVIGNLGLGY